MQKWEDPTEILRIRQSEYHNILIIHIDAQSEVIMEEIHDNSLYTYMATSSCST